MAPVAPITMPVEILETLGEGAFGLVCVARLKMGGVERAVALKILKGEWADNQEILLRTRDEARLLALLNHPYIVKVDSLTRLWGRTTIVMEYVRGASLLDICQEVGPLPLSVAMTVTQRVASALHAAYNRPPPGWDQALRVVHRDIKPSNIVVGIDGEVKVLDFGTARGEFTGREANTKILGFGSMGYLAPERMEGNVKGPEIDIFSLGVVLYEILCGHRLGPLPMRPDHHEQKLYQKVGQLQVHWGAPEPDRLVRDLLVQMMAYDAQRRPRAAEVVHICEDILRRIPGPAHMSTEAFAREVVEPIHQNRKRKPPPQELTVEQLRPGEIAGLSAALPVSGKEVEESLTTPLEGLGPPSRFGKWFFEIWETGPRWLVVTTGVLVVVALVAVIWSIAWRGFSFAAPTASPSVAPTAVAPQATVPPTTPAPAPTTPAPAPTTPASKVALPATR